MHRGLAVIFVAALALACERAPEKALTVATASPSLSTATASATSSVAPPKAPPKRRIAVTIDDLPWIGAVTQGETSLDATARLLGHLRDRRAPATGFVVCGHATDAGETIVRRWLEEGMTLGNHTHWHRGIDDVPADKWQRDLTACHESLTGWTTPSPLFFRFPYLRRGATEARRANAKAALASLGYTDAPVTVNVFDWHFAVGYGKAVKRGDVARAKEIADAYVQFALTATHRAQATAQRKVGRDVAHVLLLHANLLAADHLGSLLDALTGDGFELVSLAKALEDPVYTRDDLYIGAEGFNWLYHLAPLDEADMKWARAQSKRIHGSYAK